MPCARTIAPANIKRHRRAGNNTIAVLPFYGVAVQRTDAYGEALGLLSLRHFTQTFRAALVDDAIGGIVLDIDPPGGSVYGIAELADEFHPARTRKPVFAAANSLGASGAYWIASAASELYVTPGGEVGSIGVVAAQQDVSKGLGRAGIQTTLIAAGRYKTEGNPFEPLGANARRHAQSRVAEYYCQFVAAVAKNRNVMEAAVRNGIGKGRLLDAARANRENMVDGVATIDEEIHGLATRIVTGWPSPTAIDLHARQHFIDTLNTLSVSEALHSVQRGLPLAGGRSSC